MRSIHAREASKKILKPELNFRFGVIFSLLHLVGALERGEAGGGALGG